MDGDKFSFSADFTNKLFRIKINQIQMKETVSAAFRLNIWWLFYYLFSLDGNIRKGVLVINWSVQICSQTNAQPIHDYKNAC